LKRSSNLYKKGTFYKDDKNVDRNEVDHSGKYKVEIHNHRYRVVAGRYTIPIVILPNGLLVKHLQHTTGYDKIARNIFNKLINNSHINHCASCGRIKKYVAGHVKIGKYTYLVAICHKCNRNAENFKAKGYSIMIPLNRYDSFYNKNKTFIDDELYLSKQFGMKKFICRQVSFDSITETFASQLNITNSPKNLIIPEGQELYIKSIQNLKNGVKDNIISKWGKCSRCNEVESTQKVLVTLGDTKYNYFIGMCDKCCNTKAKRFTIKGYHSFIDCV